MVLSQEEIIEEIISEPYSDQHISRLELSKPRYRTMNKTLSGVFFLFNKLTYRLMTFFCPKNHILAIKKWYSQGEK